MNVILFGFGNAEMGAEMGVAEMGTFSILFGTAFALCNDSDPGYAYLQNKSKSF